MQMWSGTHFLTFLTTISNILHFNVCHLPFSEYYIDIPLANIAKLNPDKLDQINQNLKEYELPRGAHADQDKRRN